MDRAGKTTQIKLLSEHLTTKKRKHICTSDFTGTELGRMFKPFFYEKDDEESTFLGHMIEMFAILACRTQNVHRVLSPALEAGKTVIYDRYADSTVAYQGGAWSLPLDEPFELWQKRYWIPIPDITFFLDIEVDTCMERLKSTNEKKDKMRLNRYEARPDFLAKAQQAYYTLIDKDQTVNPRFCTIDGTLSIEEVHKIICEKYAERRQYILDHRLKSTYYV